MGAVGREISEQDVETRFLLATFGDESVLLDSESGQYYAINETGLAIWRMVQDRLQPYQIALRLHSEFEVSHDQAASDVRDFLAMLRASDLLTAPTSP